MKELSIEEKAKAYDKVVNKLKGFIAQGVDPLITRADVQDFFPELRESEGEMIRKALIRGIESVCNKEEVFIEGFTRKQIVAWLEKQGEQKPAFDIEIPFGRDSELIEETMTIPSGCHAVIENNKVIIRKGEKPTEWSDKDKQMIQALNNCIEELENTNGWNYVYVDGCDDIRIKTLKNWLKSLKERMKGE